MIDNTLGSIAMSAAGGCLDRDSETKHLSIERVSGYIWRAWPLENAPLRATFSIRPAPSIGFDSAQVALVIAELCPLKQEI